MGPNARLCMNKVLFLAAGLSALTGLAALTSASAFAETLPTGAWMRGDGASKVKLYPCGAALCAKNIWVRDASGEEKVGDVLVLRVAARSGDRLAGTAFDSRRNANFDFVMQVRGDSISTK